MKIVASILVICVATILVFLYRSSLKTRRLLAVMERNRLERNRRFQLDGTPDQPVCFGYKIAWLAVRANTPFEVANSLQLKNAEVANWKTGIDRAYDDLVFVTPRIESWVFVVSTNLPEPSTETESNSWYDIMVRLSAEFGECQYFGSHRIVGYAAWARFVDGKEQRTYAYLGESGEVLVDRGAFTSSELTIGIKDSDSSIDSKMSDEIDSYVDGPSEEDVLSVARSWSIDPTTIDSLGCPDSTGFAGAMKAVVR
jgi:hypothetical protein